jgi:hypothetical protein
MSFVINKGFNHFQMWDKANWDLNEKNLIEEKEAVENLDEDLFQSNKFQKLGFIVIDNRIKKIGDIKGWFWSKVRLYLRWNPITNKNEYIYPALLALGIEKYEQFTKNFKLNVFGMVFQGYSFS